MTNTATTVRASELPRVDTPTLIAQYERAISSYAGRHTNTSPRQKRINLIVDLLAARADAGDLAADAWMAA